MKKNTKALLREEEWDIEEIKNYSEDSYSRLKNCPTPDGLINALRDALSRSIQTNDLRLGWEQAEGDNGDYRAIVQFHIGEPLFDCLFNARTGYRAHFRVSPEEGMNFNGDIVVALCALIDTAYSQEIEVLLLSKQFIPQDKSKVDKRLFLKSLDRTKSKICYCGKLLSMEGQILENPISFSGPKIIVSGVDNGWPCINADQDAAWLDVKGAFVNFDGSKIYQPKDPVKRACILSKNGQM